MVIDSNETPRHTSDQHREFEKLFVNVRDFPVPGFNFPDITPILERSASHFRAVVDMLCLPYLARPPEYLLCIESFGYLFGSAMAYRLHSKIVLARRSGRLLPRPNETVDYSMCYDNHRQLAIHRDAIQPGAPVLVVDDFLASGGTLKAALALLGTLRADAIGAAFVAELIEMRAREDPSLRDLETHSLFKMVFDATTASWRIVS